MVSGSLWRMHLDMLTYRHHHVSLNTVSLQSAIGFYKLLGFAERHRYSDSSVTIVHLLGSGGIIELFHYSDLSLSRDPARDVPHSKKIGLDHFSLQVDDIEAAYNALKACAVSQVMTGRTGIDYFFVADPDGNRVEIIKDGRAILPAANAAKP